MKIYGIKTCSTVSKARKFMNDRGLDFDFIDYKVEQVDEATIKSWLKKVELDKLFNKRGTKYKTLNLKELDLDEESQIEWMAKENYLIKRPVIELDDGRVLVGFNQAQYEEIFDA